tara:strand:- start:1606 stop:1767 length:162 start_codon:yes stop_codon:yes gene_type:complete
MKLILQTGPEKLEFKIANKDRWFGYFYQTDIMGYYTELSGYYLWNYNIEFHIC